MDPATKNSRRPPNEAKTKANKERRAAKRERKLQKMRDKKSRNTTK